MCGYANREVYLRMLLAELRAAWAQYRARRQTALAREKPARRWPFSRPGAAALSR